MDDGAKQEDKLLSILCSQSEWTWEPFINAQITFNSDGTGELWCIADFNHLFAHNISWKCLDVSSPTTSTSTSTIFEGDEINNPTKEPQYLGTLRLEITLHNTLARSFQEMGSANNNNNRQSLLSKTAYGTRNFSVTLYEGEFLPAAQRDRGEVFIDRRKYRFRLVFDQSPFPPRGEWDDPDQPRLRNSTWWEIVEFVAEGLPYRTGSGDPFR